jgi:protein-disulfide isomerase
MSQPKSSRREALRAQQEAEERAAKRKKFLGVAAGVVVIVVAAVAVIVGVNHRQRSSQAASSVSSAQVVPPNADPKTGIITVNGDTAKSGVPTLTIYQDYQCPNCKAAEDTYGPSINALAKSGDIKLQYWTLTFLDKNMNNDASYRAAMGAASAAMVGKYEAYHDAIYKNQPAQEGAGYTDDQLRNTFAKDAGITGDDLTKFQKYYDTKATSDFVKNAAEKGVTEGSKLDSQFGTPFYTVNGKPYTGWQSINSPTAANMLASIKAAA